MPSLFSFNTDDLTGAVAAGAISAAVALRLLGSALAIAARKQDSDPLKELAQAAETELERLMQLAEEDGAVYSIYMKARKERSAELPAALRRAIETPLAAARSAANGIDFCGKARGLMRGAIVADVNGCEALLAGAVRAILCCVDENLRAVEDEEFGREARAEMGRLEERVIHQITRMPA